MENSILGPCYDLVTPDGKISQINRLNAHEAVVDVRIEGISSNFVGHRIDSCLVFFNLKSTLAQLGLDSSTQEMELSQEKAEIRIHLSAIGPLAKEMVLLLTPGMIIGKLFAADPSRRVRDPEYLLRMFGRSDRKGRPLLLLGGMEGGDDLIFERVEGRTVAYLKLCRGCLQYEKTIWGFLPTIAKALKENIPVRELLRLHQQQNEKGSRIAREDHILLVKTLPLHIRTVFGSVVNELLPQGFRHTTASVLQPDTMHSGDIYELHGSSTQEINDIPLEFYTLEPHREYVFFADRDQLQSALDEPKVLFQVFETAPPPPEQAAVFVVKGEQLLNLKTKDWIRREAPMHEFPGIAQGSRQGVMVERYIQKQAAYLFLKAIEDGVITSQGVLFMRYFPSPALKRAFLSDLVHHQLKGIYFESPSAHWGDFFSFEDRSLLIDLSKFAIPIYWVDKGSGNILTYVQRPDKDSGMFVPIKQVNDFRRATFFGIYGSNLIKEDLEGELEKLLRGVLKMKEEVHHPLLNAHTPLAMVTGGGPGAMETGNFVAKKLGILSCANVVDFRPRAEGAVINEQHQNPYVEAKMNYRLDKLVERQAEFHLDFPIFLQGGIGTDFEYALEEIRKKTGTAPAHPILLFGSPYYWRAKISSRFKCNLETKTIVGSEWVSNCFYCITKAEQGIKVYREFFEGRLPIGPKGPIYEEGFVVVD